MLNKGSFLALLLILMTSLIAACGGGGGGSDGNDNGGSGSPPSIDPTALNYTAVANGPLPDSQGLLVSSFSGDELTVSVVGGGSLPTWLSLGTPSGTGTPFWVDINIVSTNLTPGSYTTTLRFNNVRTIPSTEILGYQDVVITYNVEESLSVDTSALTFNVVKGTTAASDAQTVSIYGGALAWSANASETWLQLSKSSGTAPDSLDINIVALGNTLASGTHTATVTLSSSSTGETVTIDVTLNVEPHRLYVADKAVAFASLPSRSYLSHTISVRDNGAIPTNWTASDDATWLTLGATNGTTNSALTLIADPTGLAEGIHYATVTIAPDNDPSIANSETVRVGLYVSATDALASDSTSFVVATFYKNSMVADPLRPYVYVTGDGSDISIFNVYTAALVNTITITGGEIHDLTINGDGSTLYASNYTDKSIAVIDLDTQTVSQTFTGPYFTLTGYNQKVATYYDEPNGYPVLVTNSLEIIDASSGELLGTIAGPATLNPLMVATSGHDDVIYAAAVSFAMNEFHRYETGYSYLPGVGFYYERTHLVEFPGSISDLEVLADGSHLCGAIRSSDTSKYLTCFNGSDLTDWMNIPLGGIPVNVKLGPTGNIYASYDTYPNLTLDDIAAFSSAGASLNTTYDSGAYLDDEQLAVSGDGLRLISRGSDSPASTTRTLYFHDITP